MRRDSVWLVASAAGIGLCAAYAGDPFAASYGPAPTPTADQTSLPAAGGPVTSATTCHDAKLYGPSGELVDWFGWAISVDGSNVLIAARGDDDGGNLSGAAHVYRVQGKTLVHQQQLMASDFAAGDEFSSAVGLDGDRAIVGAWRQDELGENAGAAYVFRLDDGNWVEEAKLLASDGLPGDGFGYAAAISGDYAVVGAYARDDLGFYTGAAYVFQRAGTTWTQQVKLLPFDVGPGDEFGYSVAIDGDVVVVGTPAYDYVRPDVGAVHVFHRNGGSWEFANLLVAPDGLDGDRFGYSVAVDDGRLIAGSAGTGDAGPSRGAAYVFRRTSSGWVHEAKLHPGPVGPGDRLGGVAIDRNRAVVGIYQEVVNGPTLGYARIFLRDGVTWSPGPTLNDSFAVPDDRYGNSVAVSGPLVLAGSYYDGPPYHAGSVYTYWLDDLDDVDMMDFLLMQICFSDGPVPGDICCEPLDYDDDGDLDAGDYANFAVLMAGP